MKKIRTAVIGAGFMGKVHAEMIRRLGVVELAAVAGVSDAEAKSFGESVGVENVTSNYKTILADKSIDAVHVCTPNNLHYPISMEALKAGKAVLCEKPLTMNVTEAKKLVDLAKKTGLPNCVNHNLRYYPGAATPAPDYRQRRTGRDPHGTRPLLAGLAAFRH